MEPSTQASGMDHLFRVAAAAITHEKTANQGYYRAFDCMDDLLRQVGEQDIATRIYEQLHHDTSPLVLAEMWSILIWSTSDNGQALMHTLETWIESSNDEHQITSALYTDATLFPSLETMTTALTRVALRFPNLQAQCQFLIESRDEIESHGSSQAETGTGVPMRWSARLP